MLWQSAGEVSHASPQSLVGRVVDSEDRAVALSIFSGEFNGELSLSDPIKPVNDEYFITHLIRLHGK